MTMNKVHIKLTLNPTDFSNFFGLISTKVLLYNLDYLNLHYLNPRLSECIEIPKDSSNLCKTM